MPALEDEIMRQLKGRHALAATTGESSTYSAHSCLRTGRTTSGQTS